MGRESDITKMIQRKTINLRRKFWMEFIVEKETIQKGLWKC